MKAFFFALATVWALILPAAGQQAYQYTVDLNQAANDVLQVALQTPVMDRDEVEFCMPKVVPGTYSISNFGQFLSNFKALDATGNELKTKQINTNVWRISTAKRLARITYTVEDSWDTNKGKPIFEPAGTNIEEGRNFVLNTHGFFGYFAHLKRVPFQLLITRPKTFYGSTALDIRIGAETDTLTADSYMELADSPIMYCKPDTTILRQGDAEVLVSVYSPTGQARSDALAAQIKDVLEAQRIFLGGRLPVKKYAFLIYLKVGYGRSGMMGALEHSYSSFYFLPEMKAEMLAPTMRDIAAHEFFHIVTPLSIHSEEIHDFDFVNPKMSRHLWLYEGVVEYWASLVQVQQGLISADDFLRAMRGKIEGAQEYKDNLPFTELSLRCLDKHHKQYGNVYQKGTLIGMCLDLYLMHHSQGKYSLTNLVADLSRQYGKDKAFKDDQLFDEITRLSGQPGVRDFFRRYVEGSEPLPLKEYLAYAAIAYSPETEVIDKSIGLSSLSLDDQTQQLVVGDVPSAWRKGKSANEYFVKGDKILTVNRTQVTITNASEIFYALKENLPVGTSYEAEVERNGQRLTLNIRAEEVKEKAKHHFEVMPPSLTQRAILMSWLREGLSVQRDE